MSDLIVTAGAVLDNAEYGLLPLTADFTYKTADPIAVTMTLSVEVELPDGSMASTSHDWVYARELIDSALSTGEPTGHGDVVVRYLAQSDQLEIKLTDIHGDQHSLFVEAEPVIDFMERSLALIPAHAETADVDGAISRILGGVQ